MDQIQPIKYEKRERPPSTDQNPTMGALLGARDRKGWIKVTVPKVTGLYDVEGRAITHEPIFLNTEKFNVGETYTLPPVVAKELQTAIRNYREGIAFQMSKRNRANIAPFVTQMPDGSTAVREDSFVEFDEIEQQEQVI